MGVSRDGLWAVRAPEGSRAKKDRAYPPPPRAKIPPTLRQLLSGGVPSLLSPLLTADHRELWFQAKALVPDSALAASRHRLAGTSGAAQVSPAKEVSNAAPLGLYHSGGPPPPGRDIRVQPCPLALGWIWLMFWAWSAWQLHVQRLWRQGASGLLSGSENLLGPQRSSGLQRSPGERRMCSLASGCPDVCLLGQGSSLRSRCGRLKPLFFIHRLPTPASLGQSPHTLYQKKSPCFIPKDRDPRRLAASSLAKLG